MLHRFETCVAAVLARGRSNHIFLLAEESDRCVMKVTFPRWPGSVDTDERRPEISDLIMTQLLQQRFGFPFLVPTRCSFHVPLEEARQFVLGFHPAHFNLCHHRRMRADLFVTFDSARWRERGKIAGKILCMDRKIRFAEKQLQRFSQSLHKGGGEHALVSLVEYAQHGSLSSFLWEHADEVETWRILIFQVLYALAVIQQSIPSFRHNDLHAANVLVAAVQSRVVEYTVLPDHVFSCQNQGLEIRLWDFDCACAEELVPPNYKVAAARSASFGISAVPNHYYDMHTFCNHLLLYHRPVPAAVEDFLLDAVPIGFRHGKERFGRLGVGESCDLSPANVLCSHPFFAPLRRSQGDRH